MEIHGHCDERFGSVRKTFENNLENHSEVGVGFAATLARRPFRGLVLRCELNGLVNSRPESTKSGSVGNETKDS